VCPPWGVAGAPALLGLKPAPAGGLCLAADAASGRFTVTPGPIDGTRWSWPCRPSSGRRDGLRVAPACCLGVLGGGERGADQHVGGGAGDDAER
jgi:hypothetical protein